MGLAFRHAALAVTTGLTINLLHTSAAQARIIDECRWIKADKSLAVGRGFVLSGRFG